MYKYSAIRLLLLVSTCLYPPVISAQSILQKMLNEAQDGDTLYFGKKDYVSDNSVTLSGRKNLTLIFEEGSTITCSSQIQDIMVIQNCSDIQIYNGTYKHQVSDDTKCFGSGFYLYQSQNIRIMNIDLDNKGVNGIFAQAINKLELIHCLIQNNSATAYLFQGQNRNITLQSNRYENNGIDGDEIYSFKNNTLGTDPFESIDEKAMSTSESIMMDSLFQLHQHLFLKIKEAQINPSISKIEYDSLNRAPLDEEQVEKRVYPAWLEHSVNSSNVVVWMNIPDNVRQYLVKTTGLSKFDTRNFLEFSKYDEPDFTNMSPKAFLMGIQSDVVYMNGIIPSGIHWDCDPELEQMVLELKNKTIQQIAKAQETVVYRLLQLWENYQSAGLLFEKLRFDILGTCRFNLSEYHPELEMLDATLTLNDLFLATLRIPISPMVLKQLFFNRDDFTVYFKMQVHPGYKQTTFQTDSKSLSTLTLPNLEPIENPTIKCMNEKGVEFKFNVYGLIGQIWGKSSTTLTNRNYQTMLQGGLVATTAIRSTNVKLH